MKRLSTIIVCLFAMMAASMSAKAQEVTFLLRPGWNWIGYPYPESASIETAFGDFEPMENDMIESEFGLSFYIGIGWFGEIDELRPGRGYLYYSNRTETVTLVFNNPSSLAITTDEPTAITVTSAVVGGTVTLPEDSHVFLRGVCWGTEPSPDIDGAHTSEGTGIGSFSSTIEGLNLNTTYYVRAYMVSDHGLAYGNEVSFTTDHGYVNLGLPSGILWANCNVGATSPEGYGDYFAWGETQPKDYYSWSTYQYCNGTSGTLTKYCNNSNYGYNGFTDNLTTLLPEDDAATANWGSDWRMPTKEEWQELFNNTTSVWTTQNGVNGMLFTAANGNNIFLPANGVFYESSLDYEGSDGGYWSSLLYTDGPSKAWFFNFNSSICRMYYTNRYSGRPIRAVRYASQNMPFVINATANPAEGGEVSGDGTYQESTECTLTATPNEGYTFTNWTEDGEVVSTEATYSFVVTSDRTLVANFVDSSAGAYVDLGLPSGTLWATCNVGAETPEGYGNYFAWGEPQPKNSYNWSTYQYCNGGSSTLTKYCNNSNYGYNGYTDNLTTLLPEDDAAMANWGSEWRLPTKEEWQELYNNTTCTWTTQNGVNGRLFTATNGNSLFLPTAGCRYGSNLADAGSSGYYWSSSLYTGNTSNAWNFHFGSDNFNVYHSNRSYGRSVRAVRSTQSGTVTYTVTATANPVAGGTITNSQEGQTCTVTATPNEGYTFTNWTEDSEVVSTEASYSFTVNGDRNLVANFAVSGSGGNHTYVDLGLPSGLLWATCNIGANSPEDYGDYFAWGETQPKDNYNWNTYQYCNRSGNNSKLTKYCTNSSYGYLGFTDYLTILLPEDDAATANWSSGWRMPTKDEWQELLDNTTVTWTTRNGVNGRLFTASNGNSLFLPAAGNRFESSLYGAGSDGYYWSSSLNAGHPYDAWLLYFGSGYYLMNNGTNRCNGFTVRPVRSTRQN